MQTQTEINYLHDGFGGSIAYCEAKGLSLCFGAYAENCSRENIMEVGFNPNSGYVYIALENGVQICSAFGREVEYLITNNETGEETFYENYEEAENTLTL